ncbi:MAG TPA: sigma 54-interacting transcriptional regulator, partial [Blastocatellia bacterium]|nr:sigma 54-interacting transcriptional regulator [Blastocatellia bacterium]
WAQHGNIEAFPLGRRDVPDRFLIPRKLYGREREVEALLAAFEQTCAGQTAMMLVTGYSGIGKTSLIQELYKPIVRQRGYFLSGKFDQVARSVPFGALIQAFRGLVRQLLGESEARVARWRTRLAEALGANGGALAEVIPEIELIVGKQPPLPGVGPAEALNRFQLVFQNFVAAVAQPEHPLVVFLDDLQWADAATLSLLQPLLTNAEIHSLFLMGAYRDNEVNAAHPLARTLATLEAAGVELRNISPAPLQLADLTSFVADTLRCDLAEAAPLAQLVWEKTAGNPFFIIQFLKTLEQDGLLKFDYDLGRWTYCLEDIVNAAMTDNVVALMTQKIQRLSTSAQRALTLASCIGNSFDLPTLAIVSEQSLEDTAEALQEAIEEGLISPVMEEEGKGGQGDGETMESTMSPHLPISPSPLLHVAFLHDRVQQAAYALIPDEWKQLVHLAVGRLLREGCAPEQLEERLFDIVHHLNLGSSLIVEDAERLVLARLNLTAGRKAKSSTAYESAREYFQTGAVLLGEEYWESEYELAFALHLELAECLRLCAEFAEAEDACERLLPRARTKLDQARVHNLQILQFENQSRYADALAAGGRCLALFGVAFPAAEEQTAALEREITTIEFLLDRRPVAELLKLPLMTDAEIKMVMNLLTTIWSSAYISGRQELTRLFSATMVRLSLLHGNCEESAYGYVTHAITVGPERGDYETAYEFGLLALRLNERFHDSRLRAKICQQFQAHVAPWRQPLESCLSYAREARRSGFESGDFTYGIYGAFTETWAAITCTQNLNDYIREYSPNVALFKKLKVIAVGDGMKVMLNWARALAGETSAPLSLSDETFDEAEYVERYRGNPFYTMFYAAAKLHVSYLLGDFRQALAAARLAGEIVHHLSGTIWTVFYDFWNGLTLAANYTEASVEDRIAYRQELERAANSLAVLAENCPENYRCQSLLLTAELERIAGRDAQAAAAYECAISYAEETRALQYRALANELYARFQLARGEEAAALMTEARSCYAQWGAAAKVRTWDRLQSVHSLEQTEVRSTSGDLDLFSVVKASQAIAGEMELERLLAQLLRIALENAGAERGCLLLERGGEWYVRAEGSVNDAEIRLHETRLDDAANLPHSIINYVRHTSQSVTLTDAATDDLYGNDPDVLRRQPRSVLCAPVLHQGRLIGALYLENNIAAGAFTEDRLLVIQTLAAQAAISLENARLYRETQLAESTLRSVMEGTAAVTGGDFFRSMVQHLAAAIPVKLAFATECANVLKTRARMLAFYDGKGLAENFEYDVKQTTCEKVYEGETCVYASDIQRLFPEETALVDLDGQSYIGLPLHSKAGEVIGHLAVIDDQPMEEGRSHYVLDVLKIFAARAAVELERTKAEAELRQAMEEIERLKNRLLAENIYLQEEIRREHNFEEIVGSSPALLQVLQQVERVAPTDATVLILGETGTGKELIARAIHNRSPRHARPLVKVNCGAISAGLVESELFGHVKGAFTGALDKRTGRFELADGGTLFLDEVGELPPETQVKLLRVLQEGEFEPVGSSKTVKVNVRIIAATNRNLEDEVKAGHFRADLFYRLNVLPLHNPPLRARCADIPQLAMFFLSRYARQFNRPMTGIAQETMERLMNYDWPGNIRELQNLIERGVVLSNGAALTIDPNLLPSAKTAAAPPKAEAPRAAPTSPTPPASLEDLQRQHILNALAQTNWVIEGEHGAAKLLDLHPNTLRSRLKKMGIQRPG